MSFEKPVTPKDPDEELKARVVVMPTPEPIRKEEKKNEKPHTIKAKPSIIELANNPDLTIATISKEANRIKERDEGEVFISLH